MAVFYNLTNILFNFTKIEDKNTGFLYTLSQSLYNISI